MTTLVRAVLPPTQTLVTGGPSSDDGGDFADAVEELESFASATSFTFQPGSAGIVIGAAESAVLLQARCA